MTEKQTDHTIPEGKWQFNEDVTNVFEDMLSRSIPQYEVMREATADIVAKFISNMDTILDLGCSNGLSLQTLVSKLGARCKYIGTDISEPMLEQAKERFKSYENLVKIQRVDLRYDFPENYYGVIQAVLTFCFVPIEYRQRLAQNCYANLKPKGALVIVEKMLGETAELDEIYVERYLKMKSEHGYSKEEIVRKQLSLEGILVPITPTWLQLLLKNAGFSYVDCYWRWMNFAGWIAIKS